VEESKKGHFTREGKGARFTGETLGDERVGQREDLCEKVRKGMSGRWKDIPWYVGTPKRHSLSEETLKDEKPMEVSVDTRCE